MICHLNVCIRVIIICICVCVQQWIHFDILNLSVMLDLEQLKEVHCLLALLGAQQHPMGSGR